MRASRALVAAFFVLLSAFLAVGAALNGLQSALNARWELAFYGQIEPLTGALLTTSGVGVGVCVLTGASAVGWWAGRRLGGHLLLFSGFLWIRLPVPLSVVVFVGLLVVVWDLFRPQFSVAAADDED